MKKSFTPLRTSFVPIVSTLRGVLACASATLGFQMLFPLCAPGSASAAPIGVGQGPGTSASTSLVYDEQGYGAWFLADLSDSITPAAIPIVVDPGAGAWLLELTFGPGSSLLQNGDSFLLQESIVIETGVLTEWSQQIVTPDWRWAEAAVFDEATAAPIPAEVTLDEVSVTFSLASLAAGSRLFIVKTLEYVGAGGEASSIGVVVRAIPEPGTSVLFLIGLVGLAFASRSHTLGKRPSRENRHV